MLYDKGAVSYTFTFFADYSADWGCSGGQEKYRRTAGRGPGGNEL